MRGGENTDETGDRIIKNSEDEEKIQQKKRIEMKNNKETRSVIKNRLEKKIGTRKEKKLDEKSAHTRAKC